MTRDELRNLIAVAKPDGPTAPISWTTDSCFQIPVLGSNMFFLEIFSEEFDIESNVDSLYNLLQIPLSDRKQIESHIVKEYLQSVDDCSADFESAQAQLDWEAESNGYFKNPIVPVTDGDIWSLVSFRSVLVRKNYRNKRTIAYVCGEVAWDGEHGIALSFENGLKFHGVGDPNHPDG